MRNRVRYSELNCVIGVVALVALQVLALRLVLWRVTWWRRGSAGAWLRTNRAERARFRRGQVGPLQERGWCLEVERAER